MPRLITIAIIVLVGCTTSLLHQNTSLSQFRAGFQFYLAFNLTSDGRQNDLSDHVGTALEHNTAEVERDLVSNATKPSSSPSEMPSTNKQPSNKPSEEPALLSIKPATSPSAVPSVSMAPIETSSRALIEQQVGIKNATDENVTEIAMPDGNETLPPCRILVSNLPRS